MTAVYEGVKVQRSPTPVNPFFKRVVVSFESSLETSMIFSGLVVMNAEERLALIRAKARPVKTIPRGARDPSCQPTGRPFQLRVIEGLKPKSLNVHSEWLRKTEALPVKEWQPSHRHGPHALTKIAERLKREWHK